MPGVKGRSGGKRVGSGKFKQNLHIDKVHAKKLRYLMLNHRITWLGIPFNTEPLFIEFSRI